MLFSRECERWNEQEVLPDFPEAEEPHVRVASQLEERNVLPLQTLGHRRTK